MIGDRMDPNHDHPLFRKSLTRIEDWRVWKLRWQETSHVEELMGMLHVACDVSARDQANRTEFFDFLMMAADGWRDEAFMGSRNEVENAHRQSLAEKAFKMLAQYGFRRRQPGDEGQPEWLRFWLRDPLYFGLLRFLDDGDRRGGVLSRNLTYDEPGTHHETWAREFAVNLVAKTWDIDDGARGIFYPSEEASRATWRRHCANARPRYVRILQGIGRLDLLTRLPMGMDSEEHRVLRDLALKNPFIPSETYDTLETALLKGWQAPRVLVQVEAIMRARRKGR